MTQVVYARLESEVGGFAGWCPDTAPEPVAWNVVIWVGGARSTKTGASLGAPLGTVDGESSPAVLAAASARSRSVDIFLPRPDSAQGFSPNIRKEMAPRFASSAPGALVIRSRKDSHCAD